MPGKLGNVSSVMVDIGTGYYVEKVGICVYVHVWVLNEGLCVYDGLNRDVIGF